MQMNVPLLDLKSQYQTIKSEILAVTHDVFESQHFIQGPKVAILEKEIADYCSTEYAVGVSSGTDALLISLMAAGIGPRDRVLTTTYSFFATAGCVARLGARLIFADIDPHTYNLSPESIKNALAKMTREERRQIKAIVPVHLYGQCADMDATLEIARVHDWVVIEDAAQAIGAEYKGKRAGSMGDFGCFSFFPSKNLGAFGDGGVVTTKANGLDEKLRMLRNHGAKHKYYHQRVGGNFRLDALQAAIVSVKLKYLDQWSLARRDNARTYQELFDENGLLDLINLPEQRENRHIFNQFVISVGENRDQLRAFLADAGIGCEVYYPIPLHLQECFAYLNYQAGDFPAAEYAARHTLALPIYAELELRQQEYVVQRIREFFNK